MLPLPLPPEGVEEEDDDPEATAAEGNANPSDAYAMGLLAIAVTALLRPLTGAAFIIICIDTKGSPHCLHVCTAYHRGGHFANRRYKHFNPTISHRPFVE